MNDSSRPVARVRGLAVRTWGTGEPLVLLHGGMGTWNHWARNVDALAQKYAVHALDMPGYGDSPTVARDMPEDDYASMVAEAVGAIGSYEPVRLAGFSFGGIVAALVAAQMGARLRKVSMLGPGGFGKSVKLDLRKIPLDTNGLRQVREVLRYNLEVMMIADPAKVTEDTVDLHYANVRRTRFDGRRVSLGNRMAELLGQIVCPVQVIWGERDPLPYPNVQARVDIVRGAMPGARTDVIPGAGHWVQYEAPEAVNRVMLEFLA
jgi:2-hydroxy-6-oxonona-2,4-dienedioate hydrolase